MTPREQVLEALADFARATDARDWVSLRGLLVDDARGYGTDGAEHIVASMRAHLGGVGPTQHLLGNHRVTFLDDVTARVFTYGRVMHLGAGPMEGRTLEVFGEYDDKFTLVGNRWKITRRWFEVQFHLGDWAVLRPADTPA